MLIYVDDIVLNGNCKGEMVYLKKLLSKEFEIKDIGQPRYFLGMEVARSSQGISISQRKYVLDLLKETGMIVCKPVETPMAPNTKLEAQTEGTTIDQGMYQRLVGKLIYLTHTRHNISFDVSIVNQFLNNPMEEHLNVVYRILRYLKGSPGKGLMFKENS